MVPAWVSVVSSILYPWAFARFYNVAGVITSAWRRIRGPEESSRWEISKKNAKTICGRQSSLRLFQIHAPSCFLSTIDRINHHSAFEERGSVKISSTTLSLSRGSYIQNRTTRCAFSREGPKRYQCDGGMREGYNVFYPAPRNMKHTWA